MKLSNDTEQFLVWEWDMRLLYGDESLWLDHAGVATYGNSYQVDIFCERMFLDAGAVYLVESLHGQRVYSHILVLRAVLRRRQGHRVTTSAGH